MATTRRLRVVGQHWLAEGVLGLRLAAPDGAELPGWEPGAHLTLSLPNGLRREYSLCGDPAERASWSVAVRREADSRGGSSYVHGTLRVGDQLDVAGPRNNFPLAPASDYLLIAGGVGVTPIKAMAEHLERAGASWRLLYCGRDRASMPFVPELLALGGARVRLHADDEHDGPPDLDAVLAERRAHTVVYACGPEPLLAALEARLPGPGEVHVERFRAPGKDTVPGENTVPGKDAAAGKDIAADESFAVVCAGSGMRVSVPTGVSIVDALADAGVSVPTSCREGICGTCETKVLSGQPDHRDFVLTDAEHAACGSMMLCVSRARSAELVLDLP